MIKNYFERDYRNLLIDALDYGDVTDNRTGVSTLTLFNKSFNINLDDGFPIITGKKIFFEKAYHEYIWFKEGMVTTTYLKQHDINWWDEYATKNGYLGKTYGYQLRSFNGEFDQLMDAVNKIKMNSRRAHISLWNPIDMNEIDLPVCYTGFTFVRINNTLNMSMQFRSSDLFLGLPYDIIVGALLLIEVAAFTELKPGRLGINISNGHIYENHINQVNMYLKENIYALPIFNNKFNEVKNKLINYKHGPYIEAKMNN